MVWCPAVAASNRLHVLNIEVLTVLFHQWEPDMIRWKKRIRECAIASACGILTRTPVDGIAASLKFNGT